VREGTLSALCSDHQPHDADAKEQPFCATEPGISGLETLLPLTLALARRGELSLMVAIERLTAGPARVLGLDLGHLGIGAAADLCVVDVDSSYRLDGERMLSRGRNSPFKGATLQGRVEWTLLEGRVVHAPKP
jgi:dihydroorotase